MPRSDLQRFMAKVWLLDSGCWEWQAGRTSGGYGKFWVAGATWLAHRWVYTQMIGPIPDDFQIDHLCRVRRCVNPLHLEPVTAAENIARGETGENQRVKQECPRGHPYDEANTYRYRGARQCKICRVARVMEGRRAAK